MACRGLIYSVLVFLFLLCNGAAGSPDGFDNTFPPDYSGKIDAVANSLDAKEVASPSVTLEKGQPLVQRRPLAASRTSRLSLKNSPACQRDIASLCGDAPTNFDLLECIQNKDVSS